MAQNADRTAPDPDSEPDVAARILAALADEDAAAVERWAGILVGDADAWPLIPPLRSLAELLAIATLADRLQQEDNLSDRAAWLEASYLLLGDDPNAATAPGDIAARRLRRWLRRTKCPATPSAEPRIMEETPAGGRT